MKKTKLLLALCLAGCIGYAQNNVISTIAGSYGGSGGYSGDGGAATDAGLNYAEAIAFDASGNMYIADYTNHRIRKVTTAGVISTYAGNGYGSPGAGGFTGDGGQATDAELNYPSGVAFDAAGNLYIADQDNFCVRKVTTAGIISTYAGNHSLGGGFSGDGGLATAARLSSVVMDVALDAAGNLYIADQYNQRIRKVTTAGIISTIAGNGTAGYSGDGGLATAAKLNRPDHITFDAAGDLYIADYVNNRIRKVTTSSGIISTVAGYTTTNGFSGDGGPATAAKLYGPSGVALDAAGNIYIADQFNNRIRKVNTSGIISTIAGKATQGYTGDCGNGTAAELNQPDGIIVDATGNLYIADQGNSVIRKLWANYTNAGSNKINQQDVCGQWPGVQIGTAAMTGFSSVSYSWTCSSTCLLSSTTIAQPISSWTNTSSPITYTLTVTVQGCTATTSTMQVTAHNRTCLGCCRQMDIETQNNFQQRIVVYPNPSNGRINIVLNDKAEYIRVVDLTGKEVFEVNGVAKGDFMIDVSKYAKGAYFVIAKVGDKLEKQKLLIE